MTAESVMVPVKRIKIQMQLGNAGTARHAARSSATPFFFSTYVSSIMMAGLWAL